MAIPTNNKALQERLTKYVRTNTYIDPSLYTEHNVKRGLRNANGTGVLVGITRISNVVGYQIDSGVKIPTEGRLYYRGISLKELITHYEKEDRMGYEEVAFLLLFGKLPTEDELAEFCGWLEELRQFPSNFVEDVILSTPSVNVMNKLQRTVLAWYTYDENPEDTSVLNVLRQSINLIAKMPLMIGYASVAKRHYYEDASLVLHRPKKGVGTAEAFLHLLRENKEYTKEEAQLLDTMLIIHADHGGGNNSAFATHVVSSSGTDTYSAISTAIGSLKGPRHGGANQMVPAMLDDLKATVPNWTQRGAVMDYLQGILRKENFLKNGLIYGMGHAVYTLSDPRTEMLKEKARRLAYATGYEDDFTLLETIEQGTIELLAEKKNKPICANVDLYAGLVYRMLGIDRDLYTSVFALARLVGWCAHRLEQIQDDKIMRPAYVTLTRPHPYIPMEKRI